MERSGYVHGFLGVGWFYTKRCSKCFCNYKGFFLAVCISWERRSKENQLGTSLITSSAVSQSDIQGFFYNIRREFALLIPCTCECFEVVLARAANFPSRASSTFLRFWTSKLKPSFAVRNRLWATPSPNFDRVELKLYLMILGQNQDRPEHFKLELFRAWQFYDRAELELLTLYFDSLHFDSLKFWFSRQILASSSKTF